VDPRTCLIHGSVDPWGPARVSEMDSNTRPVACSRGVARLRRCGAVLACATTLLRQGCVQCRKHRVVLDADLDQGLQSSARAQRRSLIQTRALARNARRRWRVVSLCGVGRLSSLTFCCVGFRVQGTGRGLGKGLRASGSGVFACFFFRGLPIAVAVAYTNFHRLAVGEDDGPLKKYNWPRRCCSGAASGCRFRPSCSSVACRHKM
jgi:hypothetical protein